MSRSVIVALLASAFLSSCASRFSGRPAILSSTAGPALEKLWDSCGGLSAWRDVGPVRFTYQAEVGPGAVLAGLPREALALLRGREGGAARIGPLEISYPAGTWSDLEVGGAGGRRTLHLDGAPGPDLEDYALRSARVLVLFPFQLADPVWEFRWDLIAGQPADPFRFKAVPAGAATPHRAYLVDVDPASGLLREVWYEVEHPCLRGKVFKAVFGGYRTVRGLRVATEIDHFFLDASHPASRYPWEEKPEPLEDRLVLRERISSVDLGERPRERRAGRDDGSPP